ncbi:SDR family oxidoreductase [Mycobacterium sp. 21AC1]|uniref:SDR family oxidoreductase n=1 Tax=[Mycobacterium] appelbergii TaxID=2939269 RepID=UPI002939294C|nr:SDR family oxidoreductase [Mycobacterium sp. 21AC1]MDV3130201.1 SDR family oxidoreductase [Mycobacterium sp. 21AC1]
MPVTEQRVAVVTGGGSGIGRAAGLALAHTGHRVVFCGRTATSLTESAELAGSGDIAVLDVTDESAVDAFFAGLARLDVLVNSAGVFGTRQRVTETSLAEWSATMTVNVTGTFLCARAAMRLMAAAQPRGGRIINIGSVSAQVPRPEATPYTASKFAVTGLTRSLALEGRELDIAVGQIDVGNAATAMTSGFETGSLQPDGSVRPEAKIDVAHVGSTIAHIAGLPPEVSVPFLTIMATRMPLLGRG